MRFRVPSVGNLHDVDHLGVMRPQLCESPVEQAVRAVDDPGVWSVGDRDELVATPRQDLFGVAFPIALPKRATDVVANVVIAVWPIAAFAVAPEPTVPPEA